MDPKAMEPFGMALTAYYKGEANAELIIRRDDGLESLVPVGYFFRDFSSPIDYTAISYIAQAAFWT
ncbi:hypothetical protein JW935_08395 [candidate division KSB1 bacterium]|nr:hypothetical protein [candidate division KSB1 bacterium]